MHLLAAALLVLLAALPGPGSAPTPRENGGAPYTLTVLHTNDTHGRPLAFRLDGRTVGGIAARKTAVDLLRSLHENVLLLDAGDVCDGMPVSNMNNVEPDFVGMSLLRYDAMCLGNHEFSHDLETIQGFEKTAGFPFLCANLVRKSNGAAPFAPYRIFERGGRKIAVLGLLTPETKRMVFSGRLEGLDILDPVAAAKELVPKLKSMADHVIVLSHLGYGYDKNVLAAKVKGIDLIVGGHSHTTLTRPKRAGDTVIVQAGKHGLFLGVVTLRFAGKKIEGFTGGLVPINYTPKNPKSFMMLGPFEEDPAVLSRLKPYADRLADILDRVVGRVTEPVERKRGWLDRPFPNLAADAMRWAAGADCALQNTGGVRTKLEPGPVTVNDAMTMLPFDNDVVVVRITGKTLLAALNHAVFAVEDRPRAFAAVSGLDVVVSPRMDRILSVKVGKEPLDENRVYKVAVNSFMYQGGDDFDMFADNVGVEDLGFKYAEALIRYLGAKKTVTPAADGRIRTAAAVPPPGEPAGPSGKATGRAEPGGPPGAEAAAFARRREPDQPPVAIRS